MHFMVNGVQRGLQQHLIRKLYREELFEAIMEERQDIATKRRQCQEVRSHGCVGVLRVTQGSVAKCGCRREGRV